MVICRCTITKGTAFTPGTAILRLGRCMQAQLGYGTTRPRDTHDARNTVTFPFGYPNRICNATHTMYTRLRCMRAISPALKPDRSVGVRTDCVCYISGHRRSFATSQQGYATELFGTARWHGGRQFVQRRRGTLRHTANAGMSVVRVPERS